MTDHDHELTAQLRALGSRGIASGPDRLAESVSSTLIGPDGASRSPRSRWLMAAAAVALCGAGVAGIALIQSGSESSPTDAGPNLAIPDATHQVDDTAPSAALQDTVPVSTYLITSQPCAPATFTFPKRTDAITLDVQTATLDDTTSGVFLTSALILQRGGAVVDEVERPTTESSGVRIVSTAVGDVSVYPALTRAAGPAAYGTLPPTDDDVNDLADGASRCDGWIMAAQDQSISVDDLVVLLEGLQVTS